MNNVSIWLAVGAVAILIAYGCTGCVSARSSHDIPVVTDFDATRYLGTWHEIARLPKSYERGLDRVTATYAMDGDMLRITNRGFREGKEKISTAVGYFAGPTNEGAFRVSFFRPFYGDYRIIWLSPDYDLALVTSNDRSSLWILARTANLAPEKRKALVEQAARWGFDVSQLEYPQPAMSH